MVQERLPHELPHRADLTCVVKINPDEAGRFDAAIKDGTNDPELDLIADTGISADAEVLEVSYSSNPDGTYSAHIVGYPAGSTLLSTWVIILEVKS